MLALHFADLSSFEILREFFMFRIFIAIISFSIIASAQTPPSAGGATQNKNVPPKQTTRTRQTTAREGGNSTPQSAVLAAFNKLLDGIRSSNVDEVMSVYWESPQLIIFNNNGTVTKSFDQVRANRASSYPNAKNVKLDVRDVKVKMLGADGAIVTCLWMQTQDYKGAPESSSGRLTVVFQRIGGAWKIVHTHTSPDAPDPSRISPSERQTTNTEPTPPATNTTRPPRANPTPKPTPNPRVPTTKPTPNQ
jgi:ketosteroid isomerase-like protein